jgi:tetratricopeptide (TPR) repeat protein
LNALDFISSELAKTGMIDEALKFARSLINEQPKSIALQRVSSVLAIRGEVEEAANVLIDVLTTSKRLILSEKDYQLQVGPIFVKYLTIHVKPAEALRYVNSMIDNEFQCQLLQGISCELTKKGKLEEAASAMQKAIECANLIEIPLIRNFYLQKISCELARQRDFKGSLECARSINHEFNKCEAFIVISSEINEQGDTINAEVILLEAIDYAKGIVEGYYKSKALTGALIELIKQKNFKKANSLLFEILCYIRCLNDEELGETKSTGLLEISHALFHQGKTLESAIVIQEAILIARKLSYEPDKIRGLLKIAEKIAIQGMKEESNSMLQEAFQLCNRMVDDTNRNRAMGYIVDYLYKQDQFSIAEITCLKISQSAIRNRCWETHAENTCQITGWQNAFQHVIRFNNDQAKNYFLKGIANEINAVDASLEVILNVRRYYQENIEELKKLLQKHALHELFFQNIPSKKIERFNRTLNIQWAIDIKNSINVN